MTRLTNMILGAASVIALSATASVGFAQQDQSRSQQSPGGTGMMGGNKQMMMDCERMMRGQGQGKSGATNEQMKAMMERCRSMMGQSPPGDSSTAPATEGASKQKE
jgi:hypothetical protein